MNIQIQILSTEKYSTENSLCCLAFGSLYSNFNIGLEHWLSCWMSNYGNCHLLHKSSLQILAKLLSMSKWCA